MARAFDGKFSALDGFELSYTLSLPRRLESRYSGDVSCVPIDNDTGVAVVIGPATAVVRGYYSAFAAYLAENEIPVLTFDYRGIGDSRPESLNNFTATQRDWGKLDLPAAISHMHCLFPNRELVLVGHSIGMHSTAFSTGDSDDPYQLLSRIVSVSAQHAYWRHCNAKTQLWFMTSFGVAMPLLTYLYGYCPAKKLGLKFEVGNLISSQPELYTTQHL